MNTPLMIGIAGGTGSGKTTLTKRLREQFEDQNSVVYLDNYYKAQSHLTLEERRKGNYDQPEAYDLELFLEQLQQLKQGHSICSPVYDYTVSDRSEEVLVIEPKPVILVEGILLFCDPRILELLDIKLFVDTDADVRILRRIKRDVQKRGRSLDSVVEQYLTTVKPMHDLYVEPSKRRADLIVPEGGKNLVALEMVVRRIQAHLSGAPVLRACEEELANLLVHTESQMQEGERK